MMTETIQTIPPLIASAVVVLIVWTMLELYRVVLRPITAREILLPAWIMGLLLSTAMLAILMIYGFSHSWDPRKCCDTYITITWHRVHESEAAFYNFFSLH